jgi:hypothetical protein
MSLSNYGIFSRHFTILFNLFALMQIFNYFNCRKIVDFEINIYKSIKFINIILFVITLVANYFFITYGGNYFGFYPNGLTIKQWAFCLGMSMIVWIVGFLVKLMPSSHVDKNK